MKEQIEVPTIEQFRRILRSLSREGWIKYSCNEIDNMERNIMYYLLVVEHDILNYKDAYQHITEEMWAELSSYKNK